MLGGGRLVEGDQKGQVDRPRGVVQGLIGENGTEGEAHCGGWPASRKDKRTRG